MSSNRVPRRAVLAMLCLGGCGFTPAFGTGGQATALRDRITFVTPDTIAGFRLRAGLTDRLGQATDGPLRMTVTLAETREAAAINSDGDTTRFSLVGQADWTLTETASGRVLADGAVDNFTAYSTTGSTVATEAAADDASDRLMTILADAIVADLILAAPDLP